MKTFKFFQDNTKISWRTAEGNFIPLKELTEMHIRNIMKCLAGEIGYKRIPFIYEGRTAMEWTSIFSQELKRRWNNSNS